MTANPACTLFLTLFNYCTIQLSLEVHSATESAVAADLRREDGEWTDMVARAARSEGRMQLHVVRIIEGNMVRYFVVPIRTRAAPNSTKGCGLLYP
jgi:hypothetical protein